MHLYVILYIHMFTICMSYPNGRSEKNINYRKIHLGKISKLNGHIKYHAKYSAISIMTNSEKYKLSDLIWNNTARNEA